MARQQTPRRFERFRAGTNRHLLHIDSLSAAKLLFAGLGKKAVDSFFDCCVDDVARKFYPA